MKTNRDKYLKAAAAAGILAVMAAGVLYSDISGRYAYIEETDGVTGEIVYTVNESTGGINVDITSPQVECTIRADGGYAHRGWDIRRKKDGEVSRYCRKDTVLEVDKKSGMRECEIRGLPVYQDYFCMRDFLESGEEKRPFYIMVEYRHKKEDINRPIEFVLKRLKEETVETKAGRFDTVKVKITLNDWRSIFWKSYYWYRKSDGIMVKYDTAKGGPGTPRTRGTLSSERNTGDD